MAINFLNTVAVDENVLFVDAVNDRVGIGTDSPDYKLDIGGAVANTDNTVRLMQNNGGTAIRVGSGGASSDVVLLRIDGNSAAGGHDGATDSSNYGFSFKYFGAGSGNDNRFGILSDNQVAATQVEAITILQDGNVGIGTTTPISRLEISQQLSAASTIDYPYTISSRDDGNSINQAGGEGVGIKFRIAGNDATTPGNSIVGASIAAIREQSGDTDSSTGLGFFISQNNETLDEAVRIDHDGKVGIGVTAPQKKLSVYGDTLIESSGLTASLWFRPSATYNAGGIQTMKVTGSGNPYHTTTSFSNYNAANVLNIVNDKVGIGTTSPSEKLDVNGNVKIKDALLSNQNNTDVDTGTEAIASVVLATYTAAFFDFVIKKGTNVRSGTVYACHDGTSVAFIETSTSDLGDTSDVTLNVVISTIYLQLQATTTSDDWSVKSLIRAI